VDVDVGVGVGVEGSRAGDGGRFGMEVSVSMGGEGRGAWHGLPGAFGRGSVGGMLGEGRLGEAGRGWVRRVEAPGPEVSVDSKGAEIRSGGRSDQRRRMLGVMGQYWREMEGEKVERRGSDEVGEGQSGASARPVAGVRSIHRFRESGEGWAVPSGVGELANRALQRQGRPWR
jgi:hypothetical protein